ncbi:MAG TPA: hypothetical protein VG841_00830 [Caulobacterales bacterium]|nr:hypothetical protein [Caulobacterales bacterium]
MDGGQGRSKREGDLALSAAVLERRLNVRKRAREDGVRNLPAHDAVTYSETEQAIAAAVATERTRVESARAEAQAEAERRLRALGPVRPDLSGPAIEARLALAQVEGRVAHDWSSAADRARQARADLKAFRETHRLHRQAVTPPSTLWQAGLLFLAALFESLFSATLFAESDPRGLLGGAITAIGLSGANVVLGFLAGYVGLRYLQHRSRLVKCGGGGAFALLLMLAVILNGGAAAWRDLLAEAQDDSSDATASLWSSVLHLHSPQAVILLMLGAGVWVFAALKGYSKFDDPYPDYGKMDRAAREAEEALSEFRAEARLELEAPIEAARAALATRLEKARAEYEAMSKAFDAAALKMQSLDARGRALDEAAASAIQLYRQENLAARTSAAPAYFSAPPPGEGAARDALQSAAAMIDEARALLAEAQKSSAEELKGLLHDLEAAQARLDASSA